MARLRVTLGESVLLIVGLVVALEVVLFVLTWFSNAKVPENYLPSLLAAKITFISLLTATITFLHRLFLDEVHAASRPEASTTNPSGASPSSSATPKAS